MRIAVDLTVCEGYAQCAFLAPESFTLSGPEALMYKPSPADSEREQVLRAAAACPVHAIMLDDGPPVAVSLPKRGRETAAR
jgi:ferredoxin